MIAIHVKRNHKNKDRNKNQTQPLWNSGDTVLGELRVSFPWVRGVNVGP